MLQMILANRNEQNKNDIQNNLKNWGYNGVVQFINMM